MFHTREARALRPFRNAVCLHGHTMHSREDLAFLPGLVHRLPLLSECARSLENRFLLQTGEALDYSRAYWTPPLAPRQAFELERSQIEGTLGLGSLISITDHDEIDACLALQVLDDRRKTPVSLEWTVPYRTSCLHLGVHNLPAQTAHAILARLHAYTRQPAGRDLAELLSELNRLPQVLVVFNHPLWDERAENSARHVAVIRDFLIRYGHLIHALELNALRPRFENPEVVRIANETGHPLISGGDRHAGEPAGNLNLTNAASFDEFVSEIRYDRRSTVLFMPQYHQGFRSRVVEAVWDVLRDYPEYPGRVRWSDRVYYQSPDGLVHPFSEFWSGRGPDLLHRIARAVHLLRVWPIRDALRAALAEGSGFGI